MATDRPTDAGEAPSPADDPVGSPGSPPDEPRTRAELYAAGRAADRYDKRIVISVAAAAIAVAVGAFALAPNLPVAFAAAVASGCAWGAFFTADLALAYAVLPRGAMAAHIEKGLHAAVLTAYRRQGFTQEIQRVVIAGIGYVIEVAHDLPRSGKYALLLGFQEISIPIDPARQAESFKIVGNLLSVGQKGDGD